MKRFKLFRYQSSSFFNQVLLFKGKGPDYKMLGVGTWFALLTTFYYLISILILLWN